MNHFVLRQREHYADFGLWGLVTVTPMLFEGQVYIFNCTALNGLPRWHSGREFTFNAEVTRDAGLIPGSGRFSGEGNDNLLQYSCLENSMNRRLGQATVHGDAKSWTQLSMHMHIAVAVCSVVSDSL